METEEYAPKEVLKDGTVQYYNENGWLHREDGPAIEWAKGAKEWYRDGRCHREDGPAVEYPDGRREYWISGKQLTEAEFRTLRPEVFTTALCGKDLS